MMLSLRLLRMLVQGLFVLLLCTSSYLAGFLFGHHSTPDSTVLYGAIMSVDRSIHGHSLSDIVTRTELNKKVVTNDAVRDCLHDMSDEELVEFHVQRGLEKRREEQELGEGSMAVDSKVKVAAPSSSSLKIRRFPDKTMGRFLNGMVRVKKGDLDEYFDFGNPLEVGHSKSNVEDALVLYSYPKSLSSMKDKRLANAAQYIDASSGIPLTDPNTATEHCDSMNVIFTGNPGNTRQCTAIIANLPSYHVQRWMKVNTTRSSKIEPELPLSLVSRGYVGTRGKSNFYAPPFDGKRSQVNRHWKMLLTFFTYLDSVLDDLRPILAKIARQNAVVVMTCNMGQSQLLVNFACSARRRGFDLGNILVFPSDVETKELAEGLGLATYYDEKNMGPLPSGAARRYGDKQFTAMMYAKVLCVLYPLLLGYDVLFQDVDVVWINKDRDPLEFFQNESSNIGHFDVIFQHDGSNSIRYAPYSANSGFFYARANKRTQYLFTSLLYHSDLILTWDSQQQALVQLLAEHSSLFGLNVKILGRGTEMFPGGYHYHRNDAFMKKFVKRETKSYVFHMSWTENKDNKLLFLRQLGEWYVTDKCIDKPASAILGGRTSSEAAPLVQPCCAMVPIFSCHFRDKASLHPCKSSKPIDEDGESFW